MKEWITNPTWAIWLLLMPMKMTSPEPVRAMKISCEASLNNTVND